MSDREGAGDGKRGLLPGGSDVDITWVMSSPLRDERRPYFFETRSDKAPYLTKTTAKIWGGPKSSGFLALLSWLFVLATGGAKHPAWRIHFLIAPYRCRFCFLLCCSSPAKRGCFFCQLFFFKEKLGQGGFEPPSATPEAAILDQTRLLPHT